MTEYGMQVEAEQANELLFDVLQQAQDLQEEQADEEAEELADEIDEQAN